jgi:hypothetical protein
LTGQPAQTGDEEEPIEPEKKKIAKDDAVEEFTGLAPVGINSKE